VPSSINWARIAPIIVSILIILIAAALRDRSRTLAAILATMPINIPLALWVLSSGEGFTQDSMVAVTQNIILGLFPTMVFIVIVHFAARANWEFIPMLIAGYVGWGILLGIFIWAGWIAPA
jgi:uncharacterized membrane protein